MAASSFIVEILTNIDYKALSIFFSRIARDAHSVSLTLLICVLCSYLDLIVVSDWDWTPEDRTPNSRTLTHTHKKSVFEEMLLFFVCCYIVICMLYPLVWVWRTPTTAAATADLCVYASVSQLSMSKHWCTAPYGFRDFHFIYEIDRRAVVSAVKRGGCGVLRILELL